MARRSQDPHIIEEFEDAAERMAGWIAGHLSLVIGVVVLCLGSAVAWGGYRAWSHSQEESASNALDRVQAAYLTALGAPPGAIEPPELANPAAARGVREEYLERFRAVAAEHRGTVAGTLAHFEAARILADLERSGDSAEAWQQALDDAAGNPGLEGMLQQRLAEVHEADGLWAEAAVAHERAGRIEGYPLRHWALVDAGRCFAAAGDRERARALFDQVEREAPDLELPAHIRTLLRELRAAA